MVKVLVNDDMELLGRRVSTDDVQRIRCLQVSVYGVLGILIGIIIYVVTRYSI